MMILKMMTASWNLHWQMKIHLYYRGPAWAAEASQMLRNPLGRLQFLVHHCNASNAGYSFCTTPQSWKRMLLLLVQHSSTGNAVSNGIVFGDVSGFSKS